MTRMLVPLFLTLVLTGCAAPLVMGANLAASEAFTSATKAKVEVSGADLFRMADWNRRFERKTTTIFGNRDWTCARGDPGTTVCVPTAQATEASVSRDVIFRCAYGSGGVLTQVVSQDTGTLFCRRG